MPVLLDTSAWIDHLRSGDALVAESLEAGEVLTHAPRGVHEAGSWSAKECRSNSRAKAGSTTAR